MARRGRWRAASDTSLSSQFVACEAGFGSEPQLVVSQKQRRRTGIGNARIPGKRSPQAAVAAHERKSPQRSDEGAARVGRERIDHVVSQKILAAKELTTVAVNVSDTVLAGAYPQFIFADGDYGGNPVLRQILRILKMSGWSAVGRQGFHAFGFTRHPQLAVSGSNSDQLQGNATTMAGELRRQSTSATPHLNQAIG